MLLGLVFVGSEFDYLLSGGRWGGGWSNLCGLSSPHRWRRRAHLCGSFEEFFFSASRPQVLGMASGIDAHSLCCRSRSSHPLRKIAAKFGVGGVGPRLPGS
jgi:hypothetical protein